MLRTFCVKSMASHTLRRSAILSSITGAMLLCIASVAQAGGFQISVETPKGSDDTRHKDAVLIVRTYGCHQPADARLDASAEGVVSGKRQSLPLQLRAIGSGVYAITKEWPSEGTWVLSLTGAYNGMTSSILVELGPNGTVFPGTLLREGQQKGVHAKGARKTWTADDIDSALAQRPALTSATTGRQEEEAASRLVPVSILFAALGGSAIAIRAATRKR